MIGLLKRFRWCFFDLGFRDLPIEVLPFLLVTIMMLDSFPHYVKLDSQLSLTFNLDDPLQFCICLARQAIPRMVDTNNDKTFLLVILYHLRGVL